LKKKNGTKNIDFDGIAINEHFIYVDKPFEFFAIIQGKKYAFAPAFDEWREGVKITSDEIKKAGKFPD